MSSVPIALSFNNVAFSYPPHLRVLDDVSFHFHAGEFIALVGPNGSGKSTLLKLVLGLEAPPQAGTIRLLGGENPRKSRALVGGYVPPQHTSYDPPNFPISVLEVVRMGGRVDATKRGEGRLSRQRKH